MREIERKIMKRELEETLKKYGATKTQAKRDMLQLHLAPSLKNMYEYIVIPMKEHEEEEARKKAEAEKRIIVPGGNIIEDPTKYRIVGKPGEK